MSAAADVLEDGNRPKEDHERQDAEELEVAADVRKGAGALGARRRGRRVRTEAPCVDAGIRVAAGGDQSRRWAPATAVVVVDLLEGAGRKTHRQVIGRDDRDRPGAGVA